MNDFNKPQSFQFEIPRIGGLAAINFFFIFVILSDLAFFNKFYYDYLTVWELFFIGF